MSDATTIDADELAAEGCWSPEPGSSLSDVAEVFYPCGECLVCRAAAAIGRLRQREKNLVAAIEDIDNHAAPLGESEDGFVGTGYLVSVGSLHRALAIVRGAALGDDHE